MLVKLHYSLGRPTRGVCRQNTEEWLMGCGRGGGGGGGGGGWGEERTWGTMKRPMGGALWSLQTKPKQQKQPKKQLALICAAKHAAQQPCFLLGVSQQLQLSTDNNTSGFMLAVGRPVVSDLLQWHSTVWSTLKWETLAGKCAFERLRRPVSTRC